MPEDFDISIDTAALDRALATLPEKIAKRYLQTALEDAGEVILASMKALAPERTDEPTPEGNSLPPGILKEDLTVQAQVGTRGGAWVKVGPTDIAGHVCRWQENGWMLTSRSGKKVKEIAGKHFMAAAIDEAGEAAVDAFITSLADGLAEAINE